MRWWKRQPQVQPDPQATRARLEAERQLQQKRAETPRVEAMTARWRRIRESNHFASAIEQSFRGGRA